MLRVIRNECPQVSLTVIDLSAMVGSSDVEALYYELLHSRRDRDESEIALRGDDRYVRQLVPVESGFRRTSRQFRRTGSRRRLPGRCERAGMLDQIVFRRLPPNDPGEDEVEIAVRAAGLNFKDIMNAMGVLPEKAVAGGLTGQRLGLEVAGRVLRKGSLVQHVQVGDEVVARVAEGFCGRVTDARALRGAPARNTYAAAGCRGSFSFT